jgi:hypothetical protein
VLATQEAIHQLKVMLVVATLGGMVLLTQLAVVEERVVLEEVLLVLTIQVGAELV